MATKTIDHMDFYVAIAPYKTDENGDQVFDSLRVSVGYRKGRGFYVGYHPGWGDERMWGCLFDFSNNPLTTGASIDVEPATKNSAKRIAEMTESLKMAKDIIAALFDDREWEKLKAVLQNAARFGYTEKFKEQGEAYLAARVSKRYEKAVKPIESDNKAAIKREESDACIDSTEREQAQTKFNSSTNENSETMAQNVKAADLIGKTIVVGDNQATIVIKSVDGDKLSGEFTKDGKTTPMSFPIGQLQGMTEKGLWKLHTSDVSPQTSEVTTEADVQEVQDIVPVVTPKAKADGGSKTADVPQTIPADAPTRSLSDIKPQTSNQPAVVKPIGEHGTLVVGGVPKPGEKPKKQEKPKAKSVVGSTYRVVLLPTKDGQKWPKLYGFKDESEAKKIAAKMSQTVKVSWDRDEQGEKRWFIGGGKKYCEVFQQLADALNIGEKAVIDKVCKASVAIYEGARSERTNTNRANDTNATPHSQGGNKPAKTEKTYTLDEVAAKLSKLLPDGQASIEDIKKLLQAA